MNLGTNLAVVVLALLALESLPGSALAAATIEAKLIYAANDSDEPDQHLLKELEPRLRHDFGYKHYRLLGEKSAEMKEGDNVMLDLGHQFQLSVKHKGAKKDFQILQIDLFHKKEWRLYFELSVKQKGEPIFVKGPPTDNGLVIIELAAK